MNEPVPFRYEAIDLGRVRIHLSQFGFVRMRMRVQIIALTCEGVTDELHLGFVRLKMGHILPLGHLVQPGCSTR